jgi:hypothetical protein
MLLTDKRYNEIKDLIKTGEVPDTIKPELLQLKTDAIDTEPETLLKTTELLRKLDNLKTPDDSLMIRLDRSSLKGISKRTDSGFIYADAVLTRCGVFSYTNSDGTIRKELRLPEEVFNKDSMESLKMMPATQGHPYADGGIVTPDNVSRLQKGHVGENIRQDGDDLMGTIMITDQATIDNIQSGNKDISCGYTCRHDFKSGTYKGEEYDLIQRDIRYNHVAVGIPEGRAGNAKLNLDSNTNISVQILKEGAKIMLKKINLDGVEYEAEAPVLTALNTIKNDNATLVTKVSDVEKELDVIQAKLDSKTEEFEKATNVDAINKLVTEKVELVEKAKTVLDAVDSNLSKREIMIAVIKDASPDIKLDEKSDEYVEARFDSVLEILADKEPAEPKKPNLDAKDEMSPREKMIAKTLEAYKEKV